MHRIVLVMMCLVLAGCTSDDPAPRPAPDPTPGPTTTAPPPGPQPVQIPLLLGFAYHDCTGIEIRSSVDAEAAATLVPAPYEAHVRAGDIDDVPYATARWRILSCPSFTVGDTTFNDTVHGDVSLRIEPRAVEPAPAGDVEWYRFRVFSEDSNIADAWQASGYDVVRGMATTSTVGSPPVTQRTVGFPGYAFESYGDVGRFTIGTALHHAVVGNDTVVWYDEMEGMAIRAVEGTMQVPSDDPLAGLVPSEPGRNMYVWYNGVTIGPSNAWLITSP